MKAKKAKSEGKKRGRKAGYGIFSKVLQTAVTPETAALINQYIADNPAWSISMFLRDAALMSLNEQGYHLKGDTQPADN